MCNCKKKPEPTPVPKDIQEHLEEKINEFYIEPISKPVIDELDKPDFNYPLNEDSWVIELGGYQGNWTHKIVSKYKCNILVVEPIIDFCKTIYETLSDNNKVIIENNGISTEEKDIQLSYNMDASSQYINQTDHKIDVKCYTLEQYMEKYGIEKVDLIQVNIEGEEYPLLEKWIQ